VAALYFAFPLAFVPPGDTLTGLGPLRARASRAFEVLALFVPTVILPRRAIGNDVGQMWEEPEAPWRKVPDPRASQEQTRAEWSSGTRSASRSWSGLWGDPGPCLLGLGVVIVGLASSSGGAVAPPRGQMRRGFE